MSDGKGKKAADGVSKLRVQKMKYCQSVFVLILFLLVLPDHAFASVRTLAFAGGLFGASEKIEKLQDLEGTEYILSHKYTSHFFFAGMYLSDDGYVLQKKGDSTNNRPFDGMKRVHDLTTYYPLNPEKILEMQQSGVLPTPMPKYSIPILEYVFGYSLWLVLAFAIFWVVGAPWIWARWRRARGIRDCPSCGLQLNPDEIKAKFCGACSTPFQDI